MNSFLGHVNNRQVLYFDKEQCSHLKTFLPTSNWVLFAIADKEQVPLLDTLAKACLDMGVLYICGAGDAAVKITEAFDLELISRKIEASDDDYDDVPMTACHTDFDKGFWFAATRTFHETCPLDNLICINLTKRDYQGRISELISKIKCGWFPEQ
jgi:hypothetical protein